MKEQGFLSRYYIGKLMAVLVMMAVTVDFAWGQSGIYHIAWSSGYDAMDFTKNYYIVPAKDPQTSHFADAYFNNQYCNQSGNGDYTGDNYGDPEQPFLTTYKTNKDNNSLWIIAPSTDGYWNIIHATTGKYIVYQPPYQSATNRKSIHLLSLDSPGNNTKFDIAGSDNYTFRPINVDKGNRFFNPAGGNQNRYYGTDTYLHSGMVGLYTDGNWKLETAKLPAPTIHINDETETYTFSYPNSILPDGYSFLFTTNGNDPTVGGTGVTTWDGTTPQHIISNCHIKAVIARYGVVLSEVADQIVGTPDPPTITSSSDCSNIVTITAASGNTIYYTTDGSKPTLSNGTLYTGPFRHDERCTIKAIANLERSSSVAEYSYEPATAMPIISVKGKTVTISGEGTIRYTTDGTTIPSETTGTLYNGPITLSNGTGTVTIMAIAKQEGYSASCVAEKEASRGIFVSTLSEVLNNLNGDLILANDIDAKGYDGSNVTFMGSLDGSYYTISGLTKPLFGTIDGGTVKNVMLSGVDISTNGNAGAICNEAKGEAKIYNCGVLSGKVSGKTNVGGLVGLISSGSKVRVVNCYNYANVSGTSNSNAAGIVGKNEGTVGDVRIAMCMMYGNVTGAKTISPVYTGNHTSNVQNFTEYNYWLYSKRVFNEEKGKEEIVLQDLSYTSGNYNDQLAISDEWHLTRFPFYRHILNTHRELAAYFLFAPNTAKESTDYVSAITTTQIDEIGHWVLKQGDDTPPYPVIEEWESNTKRITVDLKDNLPTVTTTTATRDYGGKVLTDRGTNGYLTANITINGRKYSAKLPITDMDTLHYDYTYGKVVLPFANEFEVNTDYTKICTGWKIISVSGGTAGSLTNYNFADRDCTSKDLYSTTGYIFAQGGNYIVPNGVTAINIEANFAKAYYLSDPSYEIGLQYASNQYTNPVQLGGSVPSSYHGQTVYTNLKTLLTSADSPMTATTSPHDQAIVLVGNYHFNDGPIDAYTKAFTLMSIDADNNQEPDYGFYSHNGSSRPGIPPVRFDFVPVVPVGMAAHLTSSRGYPSVPLWKTRGWFELTETCVFYSSQWEIDSGNYTTTNNGKGNNPVVINSGYFVQIVRSKGTNCSKLSYLKIGGNAYVGELYPGAHSDQGSGTGDNAARTTTIVPINVVGGEVKECFMTGYNTYNCPAVGSDIRFWCAGGKIGKFLGAYMEKPKQTSTSDGSVNMTAKIDHALIGRFFGGGTSAAAPITGDIDITINNSKVDFYCGGPEFGDMNDGKTVTTHAINTTFGEYYGAGFGGTSITYNREDQNNTVATNNDIIYPLAFTNYKRLTNKENYGIGTCYKMEYIYHSNGYQAVARFYTGYAQFSLATTGNVTNVLDGCTILKDFYGAGCQGKVNGTVTSTLTGCTVEGSAFGGGFKAESNEIKVYTDTQPTYSIYKTDMALFTEFGTVDPETWNWQAGGTLGDNNPTNKTLSTGLTTETMASLGNVTGAIKLTIDGGTIEENVFGGGNESKSLDNDTIIILAGTINGSVYGGGNEADVMGNTYVAMEDGYVFNGIFGGGLSGSVGTFTRSTAATDVTIFGHTPHDDCIGKPVSCAENTGKCTIVVTGGQIGPIEVATEGMTRESGPVREGWIWGGGRGLIEDPEDNPDTHFTAYVNETDVTVGGDAFILESIIGGGEFGRVLGNTHVTIQDDCQIGVGKNQTETVNDVLKPKRYEDEQFINPLTTPVTDSNALVECSHFPYGRNIGTTESPEWVYETFDPYYDKYYVTGKYKDNIPEDFSPGSTSHPSDGKTWIGCVFGGGSGYYPYEKSDGTGYGWVRSAGWVEGNTLVEIKGGHILTNVYGANEYTDVKGKSTVKMSGGTIGVPRTLEQIKENPMTGNLFGAGKGDPRTYFNTMTNVGSVDIEITGGIIYGSVYGSGEDGHVLDNAMTTISKETGEGKSAPVIGCDGASGYDGNVFGGGKGSSTALTAGVVSGNINLTILDGSIKGSVYGGGQLASVGTYFTDPNAANYGKLHTDNPENHGNITVALKGGTIHQNVFGGGMGTTDDTYHTANSLGISRNVTVDLNENVADTDKGCVVLGDIFGCNNMNTSPLGTVTVHIHKTQNKDASQIANAAASEGKAAVTNAKVPGRYDLHAVYGGGNMAAYEPTDLENGSTRVIIEGCGYTSIQQVYGGGNAASTPATQVEIDETYEIDEVFGGGNGKDKLPDGSDNPGANVGFKNYFDVEDTYPTKADRQTDEFINKYTYGTGEARVKIRGGKIHRVYGGSNTKGNVRISAVTMLEDESGCDFDVDEAYGGGKSASMDAESRLEMACIPGLTVAYGGAEDAQIEGDVNLTITNGTFDRVFGGNNVKGDIKGTITVNIEETGCKPIIIGQLYGGGNQAPYTAPFKDGSKTERKDGPTLNVRSFTSIGEVYGGGYGKTAVVTGDTHVNINVCEGDYKDGSYTYTDGTTIANHIGHKEIEFKEYVRTEDGDFEYDDDGNRVIQNQKVPVFLPAHDADKIGAINKVFGGGNAAKVDGDTYVNIGTTESEVFMTPAKKTVKKKVNGENEEEEVEVEEDTTDTERTHTVEGADIRGNVFGGGNNAEVTGDTHVTIGKEATTTSGTNSDSDSNTDSTSEP